MGPLGTGYEIEVPLRPCPELRGTIAGKGVPPSSDLVCEGHNNRPATFAEALKVWVVVANKPEFDMADVFQAPK